MSLVKPTYCQAKVACRWVEIVLLLNPLFFRMLGYTEGLPRQGSVYGLARENEEFSMTEVG